MATKKKQQNSVQEARLRALGYLRISEASERIGRPVIFIHRAIKSGKLTLGNLGADAVRIGFLFFVKEVAARRLIGPVATKVMGLPTAAAAPAK